MSAREAYNQLVSEGGSRRLFTGISPILFRAYIVNAVTLPLFDAIKHHMGGDDE